MATSVLQTEAVCINAALDIQYRLRLATLSGKFINTAALEEKKLFWA